MKLVFRLSLALALALVTASLVVPYSTLEGLLQQVAWLGRGEAWLTSVWPGLDLDHLAAFAALGFLTALARVRMTLAQALLALLALTAVTELAQGLVPGRSPQASDAMLDILGGVLGYLAASMAARAARTPVPILDGKAR